MLLSRLPLSGNSVGIVTLRLVVRFFVVLRLSVCVLTLLIVS